MTGLFHSEYRTLNGIFYYVQPLKLYIGIRSYRRNEFQSKYSCYGLYPISQFPNVSNTSLKNHLTPVFFL